MVDINVLKYELKELRSSRSAHRRLMNRLDNQIESMRRRIKRARR